MADQIDTSNLDIREQIARIDRAQFETAKFSAEQLKLSAEQLKLGAEQLKLHSEARKLEREWRWYIPLAILGNGALAAVIGAIVARLLH